MVIGNAIGKDHRNISCAFSKFFGRLFDSFCLCRKRFLKEAYKKEYIFCDAPSFSFLSLKNESFAMQNLKTLKFLYDLVFHQVHPMNMYFHKKGHFFCTKK